MAAPFNVVTCMLGHSDGTLAISADQWSSPLPPCSPRLSQSSCMAQAFIRAMGKEQEQHSVSVCVCVFVCVCVCAGVCVCVCVCVCVGGGVCVGVCGGE